jgi:hypothetical protein
MTLKKNKKGAMTGMLLVIGGLFLLVLMGILLVIGSSVVNYVFDITVPEIEGLGEVGDWNATETSQMVISPLNTFVQNFTWVSGVLYMFGLIAIFGIAFAFRATGDKWLIGLFFGLVLILLIGCILLSNIYEDFHADNNAFANIMKEHIMLSYLILYSPAIMTIIAFIAGIILFSETGEGGV